VGEVFVVQHAAPCGERLVRGEDHGTLLPVSVVDDVKEHVRGIGAVRQIADLVDNQDAGLKIGRQRIGESAAPKRCRQVVNQLGGCNEERVGAVLNRAVGNRD